MIKPLAIAGGALLLMGLLVAAAVGVAGNATTRWREFRCPDCGFSMQMPGSPVRSTTTTNGGPLIGEMSVVLWSTRPWFGMLGTEYGVTYFDIPEKSKTGAVLTFDPDKFMLGARDGMLKSLNGKLVHEEPSELGGLRGMEVEFEGSQQGKPVVAVARVAYDRRRIWMALFAHPPGKDYSARRAAFFSSFKLDER